MAMGEIKIKCSDCGKEFSIRRKFFNRREADAWEQSHEGTAGTCSECRKKAEQKKKTEYVESFNFGFPEIEGVSKKQIDYAADLRENFAYYNPVICKKIKKAIDKMTELRGTEKYNSAVADAGSEEAYIERYAKSAPEGEKAYTVLTESNASKIIDALKD